MRLVLTALLALSLSTAATLFAEDITVPYVEDPVYGPVAPIGALPADFELIAKPEVEGAVGIIGGTVASATQFQDVGRVDAVGMSTGTLVGDRWMLTAAHCVYGCAANGVKFTIGGKAYTSDAIFISPAYNPKAFSLGNDIALVHLSAPVPGITPATLNSKVPAPKIAITLVGFGLAGTGETGANGGAGTKRFGDQIVDFVLTPHILWMFDKGEKSSIAPGDSGGPAFLKGTHVVAGVASGISVGAGGKTGIWGTYAFETRVDVHYKWLTETIAKNSK